MDLLNGLWNLAGVPTRQVSCWYPDGHFRPRTEDDIASVAYCWYQTEPHAPFSVLPAAAALGER